MTVSELIEALSKMPPDAEVYFCNEFSGGATYVGSVELSESGDVELDCGGWDE